MVMSWVYALLLGISLICALITGKSAVLSAAALEGAAEGIRLSLRLAGPLCLWSGVSCLMEACGLLHGLARLFMPVLGRLFPSCKTDDALSGALSGNFSANLLGLGNAATPMGVAAARRLASKGDAANDQLCRLIVLNTASIQILPTTVASVRAALGAKSPFDILLPVWIASLFSAAMGLLAAWGFSKVWKA